MKEAKKTQGENSSKTGGKNSAYRGGLRENIREMGSQASSKPNNKE